LELFGGVFAGVGVWMVLFGFVAVGGFDFFGVGGATDAEEFVKVLIVLVAG